MIFVVAVPEAGAPRARFASDGGDLLHKFAADDRLPFWALREQLMALEVPADGN